MKWVVRIIFGVFVIISAFFMHLVVADGLKHSAFFNHYMSELNDNYNREKYIEVAMTDNLIFDKYLKDPIYLAESKEDGNKYELGIYQFSYIDRGDTYYVSTFYFKDLGIDLIEQLTDNENYQKDNSLVQVMVHVYYDDVEEPALIGYISTDPLQVKPLEIATIHPDENDDLKYMYLNRSNNAIFVRSQIRKIEVSVYNRLETEPETILIAKVEHDDLNNNEGINEIISGNGANFNGEVSYHDLRTNFEDETLLGNVMTEELNAFNYIKVRALVIYYIILVIVTYLIFFLVPTIEHFKYRKKRQQLEQS